MTDVGPVLSRLQVALSERYRLERELGQGGMATVFLAEDLKHDRHVAIKVLHPELSAVLGGERFLAEIKLTAQLQHPHILGLIDSGECDGLLYYVMPFVDGETLRARLVRETQLPVKDAVRLATEVAAALEFAHRRGVIHRDIKPENILLQDGQALVADFGIALAVQQAGGHRITQTGLSLGTPSYMSPEQAMGERAVDARADIYALGAMTYEMLQGDPPFTGSSSQAIVAQVLTSRPKPIREFRPNVPAYVEQAVLTALEKLPADRQPSVAEFARELTSEGAASAEATRVLAAVRPGGRAAVGASRGRLLSLGLGCLVLGAVTGWALGRLRPTTANAAGRASVTSILPPEGTAFEERRSIAVSPDGRQLAFVLAAGDGTRSLWLRKLDRLDAEPMPRTTGADMPFWAPDGRRLGFFADGFLTVVDENGEARRLCATPSAAGATWGTRDTIVFGYRGGLSAVPAAGGACRVILRSDSAAMFKPAFLPDGRRLVYSRGRFLDMAVTDLEGRSLATLPLRSVDVLVAPPDWVVAAPEGNLRTLDAQRLDLRTLALTGDPVRLASNIRTSSGLPTVAISADAFAFLPATIDRPYFEYDAVGLLRDTVRVDGTWSMAVRPATAGAPQLALAGSRALWLYDLRAGRATRVAMRDSSFFPVWPVFDPTGTRLAYSVARVAVRGICSIVERDLVRDVERVISGDSTFFTTCPLPIAWSPDGARLLVRNDSTFEILTLDGSIPPQAIVRPGRLWEGQFSPDGLSLAFSSNETGRSEVYVMSLRSALPSRVSNEGARWPHWSNGGRLLTFLTPDGRVQEATIGTGLDAPIGTPRTRFAAPTWRRALFDDQGTGFAVVDDGERYIIRQSPSGVAVALVQHWPALLRRADSSRADP